MAMGTKVTPALQHATSDYLLTNIHREDMTLRDCSILQIPGLESEGGIGHPELHFDLFQLGKKTSAG